jgi:hypothetical protein
MIKSLKDVTSPHIIRSTYFAYIPAHMRYGLIFWGGDTKSESVFKLQKRKIRKTVVWEDTHHVGNCLRI